MPDLTLDVLKIFTLGALGFLTSFLLTPLLTHFLYKYEFWKKKPRDKSIDGKEIPVFTQYHEQKEVNTPRSGGALVWVSTLGLALAFWVLSQTDIFIFGKFNFLSRDQTWLPLFALAAGSLLGLIDDFLVVGLPFRVLGKRIKKGKYIGGGLRLAWRLGLVFLIGAVGAYWFYFKLGWRTIHIPGNGEIYIGPLYLLLFVVVNMAVYSGGVIDGLDGLSGGAFASIFAAYGIIALWQGQVNLATFCATILGALLSFLWFNIPPARFYMGETGILGLGTTLTVVAFLTDSVLVLPIIALLLVVESASVIVQLVSKKFFKKKVLLAAPIHHHFEGKKWPSYKVTMRFWIIGVVAALIGVAVRLLG